MWRDHGGEEEMVWRGEDTTSISCGCEDGGYNEKSGGEADDTYRGDWGGHKHNDRRWSWLNSEEENQEAEKEIWYAEELVELLP